MRRRADKPQRHAAHTRWRSLRSAAVRRRSGFEFCRALRMVRSCLALWTAAALLLPLTATADDLIVTNETAPFVLDTRLPAGISPTSVLVSAESASFTLDTRLPAEISPTSVLVFAESASFTLDTIDPALGVWTNQFGFTITGPANLVVVVEACTNLAKPTWQPLQTNALVTGSFYFSDLGWTNYPGRFYRLRPPGQPQQTGAAR